MQLLLFKRIRHCKYRKLNANNSSVYKKDYFLVYSRVSSPKTTASSIKTNTEDTLVAHSSLITHHSSGGGSLAYSKSKSAKGTCPPGEIFSNAMCIGRQNGFARPLRSSTLKVGG